MTPRPLALLALSLVCACSDPAAWWGDGDSWIPSIPTPQTPAGAGPVPQGGTLEEGGTPPPPELEKCVDTREAPCVALRAREAFAAGDVELGLREARSIPDGAIRDFTLSEAVRENGWNLCDEIVNGNLRERCRTYVTRPHLRLPGNAGPGPLAPAVPLSDADAGECRGLTGGLLDQCLNQRVDTPMDLEAAGRICDGIADGDTRGDCYVRLADRQTDAGALEGARSLCARAPDGRWRDECWFRLAERMEGLEPNERLALCAEAGSFRVFCTMHLASRTANEGVLALGATTFGEASRSLAATEKALATVLAQGQVPPEATGREFWVQAWYDLLLEASLTEDLGRFRNLGPTVQGSDAAVGTFSDMLAMVWGRRQALALEGGAPETAAGRDLEAWVQAFDQAVLSSSVSRRAEDEPLLLKRPEADQVVPVPGKFPSVLDSRSDCRLDPVDRAGVALLWGLGPAPWSPTRKLVEDALEHEEPGVRSAALENLEEKIWIWRLADGPAPAWVGEALSRQAQRETSVRLLERIRQLKDAMTSGNRPPPWSVPADGMCSG